MPLKQLTQWLAEEKSLGSPNPDRMVLATTSKQAIPHSRIVAIREIGETSVLFFTQPWSRKAVEIKENPLASATIWLPLQQRQVIIEGAVKGLSREENQSYWDTLSRDNQLKFSTYAESSEKPIQSLDQLKDLNALLTQQYEGKAVPMKNYYAGYRILPNTLYFYTLGTETFSEVFRYQWIDKQWVQCQLSP